MCFDGAARVTDSDDVAFIAGRIRSHGYHLGEVHYISPRCGAPVGVAWKQETADHEDM